MQAAGAFAGGRTWWLSHERNDVSLLRQVTCGLQDKHDGNKREARDFFQGRDGRSVGVRKQMKELGALDLLTDRSGYRFCLGEAFKSLMQDFPGYLHPLYGTRLDRPSGLPCTLVTR